MKTTLRSCSEAAGKSPLLAGVMILALTVFSCAPLRASDALVQFHSASTTTTEGGMFHIQVDLSAALNRSVTAQIAFRSDTATLPDIMYPCSTPCVFSPEAYFPAGQIVAFVDLPAYDDALDELSPENGTLEIFNITDSNVGYGAQRTHVLHILDNDPPPTVAFATTTSSGPEGFSHIINLQLSAASGQNVSVNWSVTGGTASSSDYSPSGGTVTFTPGQTNASLTINATQDSIAEPDETVNLALSSPTNATIGSPGTHTFTIVDDDVNISWGLPYSQTNIVEGSSFPPVLSLPIRLSRAMSRDVTVNITETPFPGMEPGIDYSRSGPTFRTIPAGQTQTTYDLSITPDTVDELDETLHLTMTNPSFGQITGMATFQMTILDDDAPAIEATFGFRSSSVSESAGMVLIDVYLSDPSDRPIWVTFSVGGTATRDVDYSLFGANPQSVAFSPGQVAQQIRIDLINDSIWESSETVILRMDGFNGAVPGTITNHTLTITDDEPTPTASFAAASSSIAENGGSANLAVRLSNLAGRTTKVDYSVTGGTAAEGSDYTLGSGTVTFNAGETERNITLPVIDDAMDEFDETVVVTLAPHFILDNGIGVSGTTNHTLTIVDNDNPPHVSFALSTLVLGEGYITGTGLLRLDAPSAKTVTVSAQAVAGSATASDDFSVGTSATFYPGDTESGIIVYAPQDTLIEGDEDFTVNLTAPVNATLGTPASLHVIIVDDDVPSVQPVDSKALGMNPGHRVRFRKASSAFDVTDINIAEGLLNRVVPSSDVAFDVTDDGVAAINYVDASTDPAPQGYFGNDRDFHSVPGSPTFAAGNIDDFVMSARGYLYAPVAGNWVFTVRSDDGFRLRIGTNNSVVMELVGGRAPGDSVVAVNFPVVGYYPYVLTFFENFGGAQIEFIARPPLLGSTNDLVGSPAAQLQVFQDVDIPPILQPEAEPVALDRPGHAVEFRKANFQVSQLTAALDLFVLPAGDPLVAAIASDNGIATINYQDDTAEGVFTTGNRLIATGSLTAVKGAFSAAAEDNFAMRSSGLLYFPTDGVWNLCVNSDDGFQLRLGQNLQTVFAYATPRASGTTTNRVCIARAGYYRYELVYYEYGGGAQVEFFASRSGQSAATLVGDAAGPIRVYQPAPTRPRLQIQGLPGRAVLRWPSSTAGFVLESAPSITAGPWSPLGTAPVITGNNWVVTNATTSTKLFYRLRRP